MPCYKPIHGFMSTLFRDGKKIQRQFTVTKPANGIPFMPQTVPCGYCIGCRLERSRQWALRCTHEAQMHKSNCFITLTFSDEYLNLRKGKHKVKGLAQDTIGLAKREFQLFMKRLRKEFGSGIRYYHCGEYGSKFGRPHYHACIFGFDFPDKKLWKIDGGHPLFRSEVLERLWPFGYSTIGNFDFNTAAYVARYVLKKIYGNAAKDHYPEYLVPSTGEIVGVQQEYSTMSRRPGIGASWLLLYSGDVYPKDFVTLKGREMRPPRFYDKMFEAEFASDYQQVHYRRIRKMLKNKLDNTDERLEVKERVVQDKLSKLKRGYEQSAETEVRKTTTKEKENGIKGI